MNSGAHKLRLDVLHKLFIVSDCGELVGIVVVVSPSREDRRRSQSTTRQKIQGTPTPARRPGRHRLEDRGASAPRPHAGGAHVEAVEFVIHFAAEKALIASWSCLNLAADHSMNVA